VKEERKWKGRKRKKVVVPEWREGKRPSLKEVHRRWNGKNGEGYRGLRRNSRRGAENVKSIKSLS